MEKTNGHIIPDDVSELKKLINSLDETIKHTEKKLSDERLEKERSELELEELKKKYEIANEIYTLSLKYTNLDVELICATITHESAASWNPEVKSHAGAIGLMQIMPATGMYLAEYEGITWTNEEEVLTDPIYNIRMGTRYLSTLISYYGVDGGLAAYNGGEKLAALWIKNNKADGILWAETQNYIPAIIKLWDKYREKSL